MTFTAAQTDAQIDAGMGAVVMLNASCQAVVEAEIQQVSSSWYQILDQELGQAENLVLAWRRSGVLYFQQDVLDAIDAAGAAFANAQPGIDQLYDELEQTWSADKAAQLLAALEALQPPVDAIDGQIAAYLQKLEAFEAQMEKPHQAMNTTIAQVQAQEAEIQSEIQQLNAQIASLNQQIQTDREAISKAEASRKRGILETVFGCVLAPFTGGLSLVLVGIGVATISEAEADIGQMQSQISNYQGQISGDASQLNQDQAIVATLQGLTMSTGLVLSDMDLIDQALDTLRTTWSGLGGELANVVAEVKAASRSADIVGQAWFDAACSELALVVEHVDGLRDRPISTTRVQIG